MAQKQNDARNHDGKIPISQDIDLLTFQIYELDNLFVIFVKINSGNNSTFLRG